MVFNPPQLKVLQDIQKEFQNANVKERNRLSKEALKDMDGADLSEEEKKVMMKSIKQWLGNNSHQKKSKPMKNMPVKKWTMSSVIQREHQHEIDTLAQKSSGDAAGSKSYISFYQPALKSYIKDLPKTECEKYWKLAEQWNDSGTPQDVRREMAEKEAYRTIEEFTKQMYSRLGVWLYMLSAYVDPKESIIICKHDYNDELSASSFKKETPAFTKLTDLWETYANQAYADEISQSLSDADVNADADADANQLKSGSSSSVVISANGLGILILPRIDVKDMHC